MRAGAVPPAVAAATAAEADVQADLARYARYWFALRQAINDHATATDDMGGDMGGDGNVAGGVVTDWHDTDWHDTDRDGTTNDVVSDPVGGVVLDGQGGSRWDGGGIPALPELGEAAWWRLMLWEVSDAEKPLTDLVSTCLTELAGRRLPYRLLPHICRAAGLTGKNIFTDGYGLPIAAQCVDVGQIDTCDWTRLPATPGTPGNTPGNTSDGARTYRVLVSSTVSVDITLLIKPKTPTHPWPAISELVRRRADRRTHRYRHRYRRALFRYPTEVCLTSVVTLRIEADHVSVTAQPVQVWD